MRSIDLGSLDMFRAVAREGGVLRAAARLGRVPSNVTTRVKQLEERLGVALFRRQRRALVLTPAGERLLIYAERLLRLADEAEASVRDVAAKRPLRLGAMESTAASRLPEILARLHRAAPDVEIALRTGPTAWLIQQLRERRLDAAFVGEPFMLDLSRDDLHAAPVFEEELALVTGPRIARIASPADLAGETLLAFARGCSYRKVIEDWFAETGVAVGRVVELGSYHAIVACAAAGGGYGVAPVSVLETLRVGDSLRSHALPKAIALNRTHLAWIDEPSPALTALLELAGAAAQRG